MGRLSIIGLPLLAASVLGQSNSSLIQDDTYFYGQSPPVYPTPQGSGTGQWAEAYAKAEAFVSQLTLEEKQNLTFGVESDANGCSGYIPGIPRLGFPGICLSDAGNGLRSTDYVNAYPSGISVGASWNKDLSYMRGLHMAGEFYRKGVSILLGPVVGPIGRVALGGRNWEGFSNDPYLCGALASTTVSGIEEAGVTSCTKHYIGNEQELNRLPLVDPDTGAKIESLSSNIDDKTLHEMYLWPFQDAVRAGTGSIMCAYQRVNNSYSCGNSKLQNGILKGDLGFQGHVVTDWAAQHGGISDALAGLDMVMPVSSTWQGNLTIAVNNGSLPESRLNDMVTRILASWYKVGQDSGFPTPGIGMPSDINAPHEKVNGKDPRSKPVLFRGALEGHVLVKNENNALPLKSPKLLSLYGYDGKTPEVFNAGGLGWNLGYYAVSEARKAELQQGSPNGVANYLGGGLLIGGGGSGANEPAYISSPYDALAERAYQDDTNLFWDFSNANPLVEPESDACIVFINAFASESFDRTSLHDDYSDSFVLNVADQCSNTIVVIHNAGIRLVDNFESHPNVTAIMYAHLPGQDAGRSLAALLYGDVSPSGRLPYTVAKNETDYGALLNHTEAEGRFELFPQDDFSEGVYLDYRAFDKAGLEPRYEFGHGLTYTTFSYSGLQIESCGGNTAEYPTGEISQGGAVDLWDKLFTVKARVENTGDCEAAEVAQLYVGIPGGPVKQLRGFEKTKIQAGKSAEVYFELNRRDLSEWDVVAQKWRLQRGEYSVWVGASSRKLPLSGSLTV